MLLTKSSARTTALIIFRCSARILDLVCPHGAHDHGRRPPKSRSMIRLIGPDEPLVTPTSSTYPPRHGQRERDPLPSRWGRLPRQIVRRMGTNRRGACDAAHHPVSDPRRRSTFTPDLRTSRSCVLPRPRRKRKPALHPCRLRSCRLSSSSGFLRGLHFGIAGARARAPKTNGPFSPRAEWHPARRTVGREPRPHLPRALGPLESPGQKDGSRG